MKACEFHGLDEDPCIHCLTDEIRQLEADLLEMLDQRFLLIRALRHLGAIGNEQCASFANEVLSGLGVVLGDD